MTRRSLQTIRKEAQELLKKYKIRVPPVPVEKIAEALGAQVRYSPFEGELAGMLLRGNGETVIGVNSLHHVNRQRFTIAHECGHLLFHRGDVHIDRGFRVNRRDASSSLAVDPQEIEANRFAAELLMPFDMIKADIREGGIDAESEHELLELAQKYHVSLHAMTLRVNNLLEQS